jgi:hypothetical protein
LSSFNNQNELNPDQEIRLFDQLGHRYGCRKWILDKDLEDLALKNYRANGRGITFSTLIKYFKCSKDKAQRRLKNACIEKIDKDGKKSSVLFTLDNERTKPQQYYPLCIKAKIIENKRNSLIGTTEDSYSNKLSSSPYSSSYYPLHNTNEQQMVSYFLTQLSILPFQPLHIHNIHLWMMIDKSHYEELAQKPWCEENKTKIQRERIGLREVVFQFHKKGSIEIEIACSKSPFPIETDDDVNNFFVFLGKVQDRLAYILSDPKERIVPPIDKWILKYCDFNKDIDVDDKKIAQFIDLNIQIKHVGKAFRLYVKNLDNRFVLRGEKVTKVNQPITTFLNDSIMYPNYLINKRFDIITNMIQKLDEKFDTNDKRKESKC